jgi:hypothetical protein
MITYKCNKRKQSGGKGQSHRLGSVFYPLSRESIPGGHKSANTREPGIVEKMEQRTRGRATGGNSCTPGPCKSCAELRRALPHTGLMESVTPPGSSGTSVGSEKK